MVQTVWFGLCFLAKRLVGGKAKGSLGSSNLFRHSCTWQPRSGFGVCSSGVYSLDHLQEEELCVSWKARQA